ncbi:hypothetical protein [Tuberibacillus sp. Marseille-P3662]|uniref:hypothetical protein n=1 Tax=Tuberibacillus sp. Marseille-P3662 TaxID=1965358 RepID=UPI000A1CE99A|nr:hypothetical protein [Tuberibacillus sp. Marseille-P3662]
MIVVYTFIAFGVFAIFTFNSLTNSLCIQKSIPEEKHDSIFTTINVLITILLTNSYIVIFSAVS